MTICFDPVKRAATLAVRGLDFADADEVFGGRNISWIDERFDYGEERLISVGRLAGRMVIVVWTWRGSDRHVISMRKANDRERSRYAGQLD